MILSNNIDKIK